MGAIVKKAEESGEFSEVIRRGKEEAKSHGHRWAEEEHILLALLSNETYPATQALGDEVRTGFLEELESWLYDRRKVRKRIELGPTFYQLIRAAKGQVVSWREDAFWPEHFLLAVLHGPDTQLRINLRTLIDRRWGVEGFHQIRERLNDSLRQRSTQLAQAS